MCCSPYVDMHILSIWGGLLAFRHIPASPIPIAGPRLWEDPVTNGWSGNMCECVALPLWTCIIFKGIIIVTICIIIIMWQFYVKSLTRLFKLIPTLSTLWLHYIVCHPQGNQLSSHPIEGPISIFFVSIPLVVAKYLCVCMDVVYIYVFVAINPF